MESAPNQIYGMMAEFRTPEELARATIQARAAGYTQIEAYSPFPVEGLDIPSNQQKGRIPLITLLGGILGACVAYGMQWYAAVISYPINVGNRPNHSAPSFIPITFELTILFASIAAAMAMLLLNGLPQLNQPIFNLERFKLASQERFFICIASSDPHFDPLKTKNFLRQLNGEGVYDVEA